MTALVVEHLLPGVIVADVDSGDDDVARPL